MEPHNEALRHQFRQSAILRVLGTATLALPGEIVNLSEGETQIRLDQPLPYASLVSIEFNDNLLLGEAIYCQKDQAGWLAGIRVEHALLGVKAVARAIGAP
jgi:hypothetical protein